MERNVFQFSKECLDSFAKSEDGKDIYWTTDPNKELPIKLKTAGPASSPPITICEQFLQNVKTSPQKVAIRAEKDRVSVKWTWQEYYDDCVTFANALISLNVKERSSVNIIGLNSAEWAIAYFGSIFANCIPCGVYPTNGPEACYYVADNSNAEVIVLSNRMQLKKYEKFFYKLPQIKAFVLYNDVEPARETDTRIYSWQRFTDLGRDMDRAVINTRMEAQNPGQCCTIVYTSGTTGAAKGVMLSHDNLLWGPKLLFAMLKTSVGLGENERFVSYLPLSHVAALIADLIGPLTIRAEVNFARTDALQGTLVATMRKVQPTFFFAVPRVWEKFEEKIREAINDSSIIGRTTSYWAMKIGYKATINQLENKPRPYGYRLAHIFLFSRIRKALGLEKVKALAFGAAMLNQSTRDFFASLNLPLLNLYGMSETAGIQTLNTPKDMSLNKTGYNMPGTDIKIFNPDETGQGEICFRGRNSFMGYLNNEKESKETVDKDGFIHSGDLGIIDGNGVLSITGRLKELLVTAGGENVAPIFIEEKFRSLCPICSNVIVIGDNKKYLTLLITLKCEMDQDACPTNLLTESAIEFLHNEMNLQIRTVQEAASNRLVRSYIQKCVEELNRVSISRAQNIRKWTLLPQDFSISGGEFTPTLKVKRKVVEAKYKKLIADMYPTLEAKL